MKSFARINSLFAALLAVLPAACAGNGTSVTQVLPTSGARSALGGVMALPGGGNPVCTGAILPGTVQCPALLNTAFPFLDNPLASAEMIPGFHPSDLRAAYGIPDVSGSSQTVAVIDKGDDPNAESDLAVYRRTFGLPPCTSANGCFRKSNEPGQTTGTGLPPGDYNWSQEIAIDLDMVSAICPNCKMLLVESNTANIQDFATSVDTAVKLHATVISNSYYTVEYNTLLDDNKHFNHPGIAITAAAGDLGYRPTFPASSQYVIGVGGTTLSRTLLNARGWSETVWSGTGSGCSAYVSKPSWQHDGGCAKRTVADTAVVADPQTGIAAYNSYAPVGSRGWAVYGGTSVGAPIVAAMIALAGNGAQIPQGAAYLYAHPGAFNPITHGANGVCSTAYLCTGGTGYNGPGGLGSPIALSGL